MNSENIDRDALRVAKEVAARLMANGADAVILTGSHARGSAGPSSDIDLYAIGGGEPYRLEVRAGHLVSVSWRTREDIRRSFSDPGEAGALVPAWREALILHDPAGVASGFVAQAEQWSWDEIESARLNQWVAEELAGLAEEVFKLVAMLGRGQLVSAAVQRSILALRVPVIMATHLRLLYNSENVLWDLVARELGTGWARAQATALGVHERPFNETCNAALELYILASRAIDNDLDERQRDVIKTAVNAVEGLQPMINANCVIVILIEQDERFLLIEERRADGKQAWYFPAGSAEAGESLVDAACREALEETGWTVCPTHLLRIDHGYFPRAPEAAWWRHVVVAHPAPGVEPVSAEGDVLSVEWLTFDELADRPLRSDDVLEIIRSYLDSGPGIELANYRFSEDGTLPGFYA